MEELKEECRAMREKLSASQDNGESVGFMHVGDVVRRVSSTLGIASNFSAARIREREDKQGSGTDIGKVEAGSDAYEVSAALTHSDNLCKLVSSLDHRQQSREGTDDMLVTPARSNGLVVCFSPRMIGIASHVPSQVYRSASTEQEDMPNTNSSPRWRDEADMERGSKRDHSSTSSSHTSLHSHNLPREQKTCTSTEREGERSRNVWVRHRQSRSDCHHTPANTSQAMVKRGPSPERRHGFNNIGLRDDVADQSRSNIVYSSTGLSNHSQQRFADSPERCETPESTEGSMFARQQDDKLVYSRDMVAQMERRYSEKHSSDTVGFSCRDDAGTFTSGPTTSEDDPMHLLTLSMQLLQVKRRTGFGNGSSVVEIGRHTNNHQTSNTTTQPPLVRKDSVLSSIERDQHYVRNYSVPEVSSRMFSEISPRRRATCDAGKAALGVIEARSFGVTQSATAVQTPKCQLSPAIVPARSIPHEISEEILTDHQTTAANRNQDSPMRCLSPVMMSPPVRPGVHVFCRMRPILPIESNLPQLQIAMSNANKVQVTRPVASATDTTKTRIQDYTLDSSGALNSNILAYLWPVAEGAIPEKNICIVLYGQSGTGKSHTVKSFFPAMMQRVFGAMTSNVTVEIGFLEFLGNRCCDLLLKREYVDVQVRDSGEPTYDLPSVTVQSVAGAEKLFHKASRTRRMARTPLNETSSRGHFCINVTITTRCAASGDAKRVTVTIWDLAGTEMYDKTGTDVETQAETAVINVSLKAIRDAFKGCRVGRARDLVSSLLTCTTRVIMLINPTGCKTGAALAPRRLVCDTTCNAKSARGARRTISIHATVCRGEVFNMMW